MTKGRSERGLKSRRLDTSPRSDRSDSSPECGGIFAWKKVQPSLGSRRWAQRTGN